MNQMMVKLLKLKNNKQNSNILFYNIFDEVIKHGRESGTLNSAESSWTTILQRHNLITKATRNHSLRFSLLRENKIWWGDENGNII